RDPGATARRVAPGSRLSRELAPRAKGRAEARARPGHERVAADAMAFEPLADAPPASCSYSPCQTAQFLWSRHVAASGFFSFSFHLRRSRPRTRGLAERRETSQPCTCRAVTRDATLARRGSSRATGRSASRRSAVALSAQDRLRARGLACGRADAKAPR